MPEEFADLAFIIEMVQEALHNVTRHAAAHTVRIAAQQEEGSLLLSIQDDGRGFDVGRSRGLGLLGMAERIGLTWGNFASSIRALWRDLNFCSFTARWQRS